MTGGTIALHRFGLGPRRGEQAPAQPQAWLLGQVARFEPRPGPLRDMRTSAATTAQVVEYIREIRQATEGPRQQQAMAQADANGIPQAVADRLRQGRDIYIGDVGRRGQLALTSDTPFVERLVHFWSNHFTVSAAKPLIASTVGPFEFDAIRPNVTGKFVDLLKAAALHPAMLAYLDQFQSIGPNSVATRFRQGRGPVRGLNENLAREILELHTLGVDGGYAQADVTEFARALTGWTLDGLAPRGSNRMGEHGAAYVPLAHEPGTRTILGRTYRQEGPRLANAILDDLAAHPATARFIATKLARHFAGDEPPPAMVARLAEAFGGSGGDLPTVYRALVASPEAWVEGALKFRQPWEWAVASLRAVGVEQLPPLRFTGLLTELGQGAWLAPSPAGYDDMAASWLAPDALLRRAEAADRIAAALPGVNARELAGQVFGATLSEMTASAIERAESPAQATALLLMAPEMMRR